MYLSLIPILHTVVHNPLLSVCRSIMSYPAILRQVVAMLTGVSDVEVSRLVVGIPHNASQEGPGDTGAYSKVDIGPLNE